MNHLRIVMDTKNTPDGKPIIDKEDGTIHRGDLTIIGGVPHGMSSGKPSVMLVLKLDNGDQVYGETTMMLFQMAAKALHAHYEGELLNVEEQGKKTLGQLAFEAYTTQRGGKNHDGSPTPPWDELGDDVRDGWQAAAASIIVYKGLGIHAPDES